MNRIVGATCDTGEGKNPIFDLGLLDWDSSVRVRSNSSILVRRRSEYLNVFEYTRVFTDL